MRNKRWFADCCALRLFVVVVWSSSRCFLWDFSVAFSSYTNNNNRRGRWILSTTSRIMVTGADDDNDAELYNCNSPPVPNGPKGLAFSQQTPHSGRHFYPSHPAYSKPFSLLKRRRRKRFMEGWYYRLTLSSKDDVNGKDVSFALIISIEDPGNDNSDLQLACIQVVGPDDGYIVQADRDGSKFWAWKHQQGLGCTFEATTTSSTNNEKDIKSTAKSKEDWYASVTSGFQILPNEFLGKVEGSRGGVLPNDDDDNLGSCSFDFTITPKIGWGDQRSTGGWLSNYNVFEPHWQVTLADATATGSITWNGTCYPFHEAKFYAEKNWGAALPPKWYWTQCNKFDNYYDLAITAGGGIRTIPFGRREALGMIGVHYQGVFYEAVPWAGHMEWNISTWGSWILKGNSTFGDNPFSIEVSYVVDPETNPGLVFRAPTPDAGMVYFCRDTFTAQTNLTLWELEWDNAHKEFVKKWPPLVDGAISSAGGAEIGGGPWWATWKANSVLKQPIKALLQAPVRTKNMLRKMIRS